MTVPSDAPWLGAVLCGGRSRRMGEDKAWLTVNGMALAEFVAGPLGIAVGSPAVMVGGDEDAALARGFVWIADASPGEGPVGGVLSALAVAQRLGRSGVLVAGCDQPALEPHALRLLTTAAQTRRAGPGATSGAARADRLGHAPIERLSDAPVGERIARYGRDHLPAAVPVSLTAALQERFASGERSLRGAFAGIVVELATPPGMLLDLDTPEEVAAWRATGFEPDR